eukprot:COSAG05_NODE_276_length_12393_cov_1737.505694_15_plen_39_part_00
MDFAPGDFVQLLTSEMLWAVAQVNTTPPPSRPNHTGHK